MKMDLKNRLKNVVIFSDELDTVRELLLSAVRAGTNLRGADLRGADLHEIDLYGVDLREVDLYGADLHGACLRRVCLEWSDLRGVNLRGVDLRGSDLRNVRLDGADLRGANLLGSDLRGANLRGSVLQGANLRGSDLRGAHLRGADLFGVCAEINGHRILQINGLAYPIIITDTHLRAECQNHTFAAWRAMTPEKIAEMDGQRATDFFPVLLGLIDLLCQDRINDCEV